MLEITRGLLRRLKSLWTLVHRRLKIGPAFLPPFVNSAFYYTLSGFAHKAQQTELNQTLPNRRH